MSNSNLYMLKQGSKESPIELIPAVAMLKLWLVNSTDNSLCPTVQKNSVCLWLKIAGHTFRFNADTSREAITEFLRVIDQKNKHTLWVVKNEEGVINKVVIKTNPHDRLPLTYLSLYSDQPFDDEFELWRPCAQVRTITKKKTA